jgi:hypothetical protein
MLSHKLKVQSIIIKDISKIEREIKIGTKSGSRVDAITVTNDILGGLGEDAIALPGKKQKTFQMQTS